MALIYVNVDAACALYRYNPMEGSVHVAQTGVVSLCRARKDSFVARRNWWMPYA
jgi:hypothetical protein